MIEEGMVSLINDGFRNKSCVDGTLDYWVGTVGHRTINEVRGDIGTVAGLKSMLLCTASCRSRDRLVRWMVGA